MIEKHVKQISLFFLIYVAIAVAFYFIGGDQLKYKYVVSPLGNPDGILEELTKEIEIRQPFVPTEETLETIDILFCTYARENAGTVTARIFDDSGAELAAHSLDISALEDNDPYKWVISSGIPGVKGKNLTLALTSDGYFALTFIPLGQLPLLFKLYR